MLRRYSCTVNETISVVINKIGEMLIDLMLESQTIKAVIFKLDGFLVRKVRIPK